MNYFLFSQDPNISNLHTFRTYINPGYVGFVDNLNVNIGHHRQWLYVPRVLEYDMLPRWIRETIKWWIGPIGM